DNRVTAQEKKSANDTPKRVEKKNTQVGLLGLSNITDKVSNLVIGRASCSERIKSDKEGHTDKKDKDQVQGNSDSNNSSGDNSKANTVKAEMTTESNAEAHADADQAQDAGESNELSADNRVTAQEKKSANDTPKRVEKKNTQVGLLGLSNLTDKVSNLVGVPSANDKATKSDKEGHTDKTDMDQVQGNSDSNNSSDDNSKANTVKAETTTESNPKDYADADQAQG